ncbi:MAG: hypothetical protein WC755_00555 [Candidatus Woesearchaeota archaeon]|jgi:hypothetical protein
MTQKTNNTIVTQEELQKLFLSLLNEKDKNKNNCVQTVEHNQHLISKKPLYSKNLAHGLAIVIIKNNYAALGHFDGHINLKNAIKEMITDLWIYTPSKEDFTSAVFGGDSNLFKSCQSILLGYDILPKRYACYHDGQSEILYNKHKKLDLKEIIVEPENSVIIGKSARGYMLLNDDLRRLGY